LIQDKLADACNFIDFPTSEHASDKTLIPQISKLLSDKTVASFGDGPGVYKREIEKLGHVKLYDAFDGAPYCEETSYGRVRFMDLSIPQYGIRQYDWIISWTTNSPPAEVS
jgi:hypothetical protein